MHGVACKHGDAICSSVGLDPEQARRGAQATPTCQGSHSQICFCWTDAHGDVGSLLAKTARPGRASRCRQPTSGTEPGYGEAREENAGCKRSHDQVRARGVAPGSESTGPSTPKGVRLVSPYNASVRTRLLHAFERLLRSVYRSDFRQLGYKKSTNEAIRK